MEDTDRQIMAASAGWRLKLISDSFARLTGRALADGREDPEAALWNAPRVILAHAAEADPLFFYANRLALELFEMPADTFVGMPSRFSAEPMAREERAALFDRVVRDGYIDDYSGVRISSTGRRFRIDQATVWNLIDDEGEVHGQAAAFDKWVPLD